MYISIRCYYILYQVYACSLRLGSKRSMHLSALDAFINTIIGPRSIETFDQLKHALIFQVII